MVVFAAPGNELELVYRGGGWFCRLTPGVDMRGTELLPRGERNKQQCREVTQIRKNTVMPMLTASWGVCLLYEMRSGAD
jgi:hypothetical protein